MGACAQIAVFTFAYTANCQQLLYPFSRLNVGTDNRSKLLCALLLPQRGHRRQGQASLHPSSASAWAQEIGGSFSVPFFRLSMGTDDRGKLVCALLPASAWAQVTGSSFSVPFFRLSMGTVTGASFSVPLKQDVGHYTQDLMITPRAMKTTGA